MRLSNFIFNVFNVPEPDTGGLIKYKSEFGSYGKVDEIRIYQGMMLEDTSNAQHYTLSANIELTKDDIAPDNKLMLTGSLSGHYHDNEADIKIHTFTVINGDNKG